MWFKLATAKFTNHLGSMESLSKSYRITYETTGLSGSPALVPYTTLGESITQNIVMTVKTGYVFKSGSTISIGGSTVFTAAQDYAANETFNFSYTLSASITVTGTADRISGDSGGEDDEPTNYTFTINPTPTSATVTLSATGYSTVSGTGSKSIAVANGTTVSWSVSADGYTTRTGNWTISSGNKIENITLSEAVAAGSIIFDFDFANNTLDKYVTDGVITIPSTSKTDTVTYDTKGITTTGTALPACLNNGVKLVTPFDIGSIDWTLEIAMTMDPWQESFGVTEALYKNIVFFSADEHDTEAEYAHASNCLAPAAYMNAGGFSFRGPDNGSATKNCGSMFNPDGVEHIYKLSYLKDSDELVWYLDGTQKQKISAGGAVGGTIQYLLGVHYGYSSAKNFALKMGMHIRQMKMYTN